DRYEVDGSSKTFTNLADVQNSKLNVSGDGQLIKYEVYGTITDHTKDHKMGDAFVESKQVRPEITVEWDDRMNPANKKPISVDITIDDNHYETVNTQDSVTMKPVDKFNNNDGTGRRLFDAKETIPDSLFLSGKGISPENFSAHFRLRERTKDDRDPNECPLPLEPGKTPNKDKRQYGVRNVQPMDFKNFVFTDINLGFFRWDVQGFHESLRADFALPQGS
ncbi:hypothetical protein, partial [Histophilus somni]|uniref:hypothetical protein n=1 Tax=Histophilus somni TaxID=731 RepID=UPI00201ECFF6